MTPDLRDLDRAIAEARGETHFSCNYSADPAWMLRLLEELAAAGQLPVLSFVRDNRTGSCSWWLAIGPILQEGDTPGEAVARAWLAWESATRRWREEGRE